MALTAPDRAVILGHQFGLMIGLDAIHTRIAELAHELNERLAVPTPPDQEPILMPVLIGAFPFAAALLPQLQFAYRLHPVKLSSYGDGMRPAHAPVFELPPPAQLEQHPIIVLEDIVDSGQTLQTLFEHLQRADAAQFWAATLLFKPDVHSPDCYPPDWVGFAIPEAFVVGFGLDFQQQGRHLPGIYQLIS